MCVPPSHNRETTNAITGFVDTSVQYIPPSLTGGRAGGRRDGASSSLATDSEKDDKIEDKKKKTVSSVKKGGAARSAARFKSEMQAAFSHVRDEKLHDLLAGHGEYVLSFSLFSPSLFLPFFHLF